MNSFSNSGHNQLHAQILETALELGTERGWDAVHLHDIALQLGVSLSQIAAHFDQKDALTEAWFDRADAALLAVHDSPGWMALTVRDRLQKAILVWLDALASHRELTGQMLRYKFRPEHLHLQVLGVLRVSRTVQWIREAAASPSIGWRRELEEAALTAIFLSTFASWLADATEGSVRTTAYLSRLLSLAESAALQILPRP